MAGVSLSLLQEVAVVDVVASLWIGLATCCCFCLCRIKNGLFAELFVNACVDEHEDVAAAATVSMNARLVNFIVGVLQLVVLCCNNT